jgi:hypothetical protein
MGRRRIFNFNVDTLGGTMTTDSKILSELIREANKASSEALVNKAREFAKGFLIGYLEDREDIHWIDDLCMGMNKAQT